MLVIAFVVLVPAMWFGIISLLSQLSGWERLAAAYRAEWPPSGERFILEWAKVGGVYYGRCLTVYRAPEGIYLSIWPIFRFRQPPLFIPWSELRNRREKRLCWARVEEFDVGSPSVGTLQLRPALARMPGDAAKK
jgi:hypothetical protein